MLKNLLEFVIILGDLCYNDCWSDLLLVYVKVEYEWVGDFLCCFQVIDMSGFFDSDKFNYELMVC